MSLETALYLQASRVSRMQFSTLGSPLGVELTGSYITNITGTDFTQVRGAWNEAGGPAFYSSLHSRNPDSLQCVQTV